MNMPTATERQPGIRSLTSRRPFANSVCWIAVTVIVEALVLVCQLARRTPLL